MHNLMFLRAWVSSYPYHRAVGTLKPVYNGQRCFTGWGLLYRLPEKSIRAL